MTTISKSERALLLKQANASRALYRAFAALPWALLLLALIALGMWVGH